jgi:hypothetical protein
MRIEQRWRVSAKTNANGGMSQTNIFETEAAALKFILALFTIHDTLKEVDFSEFSTMVREEGD